MTAAALPYAGTLSPPVTQAGHPAARWAVGFIAFLGAFVIREPAPYELVLLVVMVVFLLFGLRLSRISITLATLFLVFNIGGMISMFTMPAYKTVPLYLAVSLFLGLSSVFWCAVVEADMGRLRTIMRGYVAGATITALLGIGGYFGAFPGASLFTLYDRAMGAFQDPNVFGPFLVLPAVYLIHGLLYRGGILTPVRAAILLILVAAIFLSFSRAAWGLLLIAGLGYYVLALATERDAKMKLRLVVLGGLGIAAAVLALVVALQFEAVSSMFDQRARVVQDYDGANLGRFARHAIGFQWALENPLGIGPLEFGQILGEDTHNIWVKSLMAYGWLGFASYLTLTIATLIGGGRLLGRARPWKPFLHCVFVVYVGHIIVGWVIDIDHWRHAYLLIGLIWGMMALESRWLTGRMQNT
ncbi:O-antigen ligase family protein [Rhizobiaceae bacterium]|nr:O-antigen ligase family protein [Rhizobiaceae bacterium]